MKRTYGGSCVLFLVFSAVYGYGLPYFHFNRRVSYLQGVHRQGVWHGCGSGAVNPIQSTRVPGLDPQHPTAIYIYILYKLYIYYINYIYILYKLYMYMNMCE